MLFSFQRLTFRQKESDPKVKTRDEKRILPQGLPCLIVPKSDALRIYTDALLVKLSLTDCVIDEGHHSYRTGKFSDCKLAGTDDNCRGVLNVTNHRVLARDSQFLSENKQCVKKYFPTTTTTKKLYLLSLCELLIYPHKT